MANLVYKRVPADQQSTDRQNLVLAEAGIEDPVVFEQDVGTSSRLHPLERPKFGELLTYGRPGDTVHIYEMFRLVRGTGHILDVLNVLHRGRLALRIHDGAFAAMDLTARPPRTGELLSTVKFMVQTLAAAGELQRDLQRELTYDGLRAAEAKGHKGGRRPAITAAKTDAVRTARTSKAARSPPSPASTASAAAPYVRPSPTSCPSTPQPPTRTPQPRSCRSPSTCPARSPASRRFPHSARRREYANRVPRPVPRSSRGPF
ncbi:recombinase family protein [Streptomyces sp. 3N207]|uniref:recombinase family protein n=1 Tax=Streptomyces sp. 3N207 TaxID=3457417 RepID=UPI003FD3630A